jgi:hypothetical protein
MQKKYIKEETNSENEEESNSNLSNSPNIFQKKMKKSLIKPLKHIYSDNGRIKHFTPGAQEWHNSIYLFEKNNYKTLPSKDNNLINLLKSYFNLNLKLGKIYKIKKLKARFKRLSAKRIFIGKGNLKHTNHKVIITFYLYNTESMTLFRQFRKMRKILFTPIIARKKGRKWFVKIVKLKKIYRRDLFGRLLKDQYGNYLYKYNRPYTLKEYLSLPKHSLEWYNSYILHFVNKLNLQYSKIILLCESVKNLMEKSILQEDEKQLIFNKISINTFFYPDFKLYMRNCFFKYSKVYYRILYLLRFNNLKFSVLFIEKLKDLVRDIYNKEVEFNIVNLKKMHFNSDIFTQIVSLKLRNRNNRLYRVLKASLWKVKVGNVRKPSRQGKGDKNNYFINKIRNDNVNSMFTEYNIKDPLSNLLLKYFPGKDELIYTKNKKKLWQEYYMDLDDYVFSNLKHKKVRGVRVEAKGRLTRRFTASRSVFKMRWKGGLKNVDSSFKGWSATVLRGYLKSNVEYSLLNYYNRNGSYGIKSWIGNK